MNQEMPLLTVKRLDAYFGNFQALKKVEFEVQPNTITALIGPSGCGKSTFIRCLNRLHEEIDEASLKGEIFLEGEDLNQADPVRVRKKVGMVFQKPNPFPGLSIFENVAVGLKLSGMKDKNEIQERVEWALRSAALWDEVNQKLNKDGLSLSGGQQQRLCIARALAVKPSILLMDEPTSALDPISTQKVENLMADLAQKTTVIVVTHNMQQAQRIADHTAFFYLGELVEMKPTKELFEAPVEVRTQEYLSGAFS